MREHRLHQIFFGGLQLTTNNITLDQLSDFSPNHMGAQKFTGFCVKYSFDHAFRFAQSNCLAIAHKGETSHTDLIACITRLSFSMTHTGHLRRAIGAASNAFRFDRMR